MDGFLHIAKLKHHSTYFQFLFFFFFALVKWKYNLNISPTQFPFCVILI